VGIDLGIKRFATLSDGSYYEPLNSFKKLENKLTKEQRKLSRKIKFSSNWYKQKQKISKLYINIADARKDYLHKISTEISKNHAMIVMEDLKINNMSKSAKGTIENPGKCVKQKSGLNKAILDQGWFMFRSMLEYKQRWAGGHFEAVPPHYTSQTCPICNHVSKNNRKTQSEFKCELCSYEGNADHVAAINILRRAGHARIACGDTDPIRELAQEPRNIVRKRMPKLISHFIDLT
jgi:putative transposase